MNARPPTDYYSTWDFLRNTRKAPIRMPSVPDIAHNKQVAAEYAAGQVMDGMVLGLGWGSTAELILPAAEQRREEPAWATERAAS